MLQLRGHRGERGIREGTQHSGHVAQGGAFATPLNERLGGLALEVDNHEILASIENLAQVEIPVRTYSDGSDAMLEKGLETAGDALFVSRHPLGELAYRLR